MQEIERIKNGWKQFRVCCSEDFAKLIDHIDKLEAENERLRKNADRMREALTFYAQGEHFHLHGTRYLESLKTTGATRKEPQPLKTGPLQNSLSTQK